jgi:dTDP-4-amino-4,6-dideoxygalactose transaminase
MVDTRTQYHRIKAQVDAAVLDVMESTAFVNGKPVHDFAHHLANYAGVKHVIPCANGTDALQIAMMALGLQPGDEVITPSFTYIATTEVIALLGLTPVFVEVDEKTFCIDPASLEKAITPKTKAIVPVHLYGHPAPMAEILEIANRNKIPVIEDNAQALGASYIFPDRTKRKTGSMGLVNCTSFYPSKNLGAFGDGGAIFTDDEELATRIRMVTNHGQSKQYYHDIVGCNSRLDSIQAAILNIKLNYLDEYVEARRRAAQFYDNAFASQPGITVPYEAGYAYHAFHQYTIQLEQADRDELKKFLAGHDIPAMIYYPVPGHRQKMFGHFKSSKVDLPVTDALTKKVISLPMHSELEDDQLHFITGKVLEFINK